MTQALAVFHDAGGHWADRWLKRGFRHVFTCIVANGKWVRLDARNGQPVVEIVARAEYWLDEFYETQGYAVVKTERVERPSRWPLICANCVGMAKVVLGVRASRVVTPWQLFRHLGGST